MMVKNEFEVIHVPRFREPDIVQFAEAVDATHGIYQHRSVGLGFDLGAWGLGFSIGVDATHWNSQRRCVRVRVGVGTRCIGVRF